MTTPTEILQNFVGRMRDDYKASVVVMLNRAVEKNKDEIEGKTYMQVFGTYKPLSTHPFKDFLRRAFVSDTEAPGYIKSSFQNVFKLDTPEKVAALVEKEAEYMTSMMYDGFIKKNTAKLDGIIKDRKVVNHTVRIHPNLEGFIHFNLDDGCRFEVSFSIVTKYSCRGRWFVQFPTRFHSAWTDKGTRQIKSPSEAKLKKEF